MHDENKLAEVTEKENKTKKIFTIKQKQLKMLPESEKKKKKVLDQSLQAFPILKLEATAKCECPSDLSIPNTVFYMRQNQ